MALGEWTLSSELRNLKKLFPKDHKRFQIEDGAEGGLLCKFIDNKEKKHFIRVHVIEPYPENPPVWFTENDDRVISKALDVLSDLDNLNNTLVNQVEMLLRKLCRIYKVPLPFELNVLARNDNEVSQNTPALTSSKFAVSRLMTELKDIHNSDSYGKMYTVQLVGDSLFEWTVMLKTVDSDSLLHHDLMKLKQQEHIEGIELHIKFNSSYPFQPPFIRVVYPIIYEGYVLNGGCLCLELLTDEGWNVAYTMEAVILQIAVSLVVGHGRVIFAANRNEYSMKRAKKSFRGMLDHHAKTWWRSSPQKQR